jgi:hypothetical protein
MSALADSEIATDGMKVGPNYYASRTKEAGDYLSGHFPAIFKAERSSKCEAEADRIRQFLDWCLVHILQPTSLLVDVI